MTMINRQDTNGTKSTLLEGELAYDKQGADRGRVYVGTDAGNVPLAKKAEVDTKLDSTNYTASDVLNKIKIVDGDGSGLDADTLDGENAVDLKNYAIKMAIALG